MNDAMTLRKLLAVGNDDAPALLAPNRPILTYGGLRARVEKTLGVLNKQGIGRGDRRAMVLPNGSEMASAFVACAAGTTTAPLNPAYRDTEFEFYLADLDVKALVVEQGSDSAAVEVARKLNIAVLRLVVSQDAAAGTFDLIAEGEVDGLATSCGFADAKETALVLHTSGTTSRPKLVPLSQTNLFASARNIHQTLALTPEDRCMNIMPLFHIHGLMAAILASLSAGASVYCTPGFNALKFFGWLDNAKPSWYTAVPTMHQAILGRAGPSQDIIERNPLRLIRSSSSPLPPQVLAELEQTFRAPVIEAYAMTEAAHQMTSNPLPPGARKPGTVGIAAGPEVAIMDELGRLLPAASIGEVVIKGPNVTAGYEHNPKANAEAFTGGWLRTGDQGVMDEDGYFTITGRLKEIINRGGEKISPREVDDVLMDHPSVRQVVTFAAPHKKLGEEVAVAVVLRDGEVASEKELRAFASTRLADFKVPRKVVFVDEIPKGPTGKLQRIGLADKLGLSSA